MPQNNPIHPSLQNLARTFPDPPKPPSITPIPQPQTSATNQRKMRSRGRGRRKRERTWRVFARRRWAEPQSPEWTGLGIAWKVRLSEALEAMPRWCWNRVEMKKKCYRGEDWFPIYGMKSLGTPNDQAPNHTSLEATRRLKVIPTLETTHRLVMIPRTTTLHKCPPWAPHVAQPPKRGWMDCFNPPFLSGQNNQVKRGHCRDLP